MTSLQVETTYNVEAIRADFPILQRRINGHSLIYLDNAATSQKPRQVIDALVHYYEYTNANVHRGLHTLAEEATVAYEAARAKVARFIGAEPECVVFTRNTTEAINLVAYAWGLANLKPGDQIVLSEMEHHSNIVPWQLIARLTGAQLHYVPFTPEGELDTEAFEEALRREPKLVAITHVSNVLGTINPVEELTREAQEAGAKVLIDGAQAAPHKPVDVTQIGCDFYAFSGHKMLAPTGIGALYARRELLEQMEPFMGGGSMIRRVTHEYSTWADIPTKFEAGTPNIADGVAFGAAVDYLQQVGIQAIQQHEQQLTAELLHLLEDEEDIVIYGPRDPKRRCGLVSFNFKHVHPHDVAQILDKYGIAIRAGHHCCQLIMRRLDVTATARASFYLYNTIEEVRAFWKALREVRKVFGKYGGR
ncbi:MAG: cysteine desulfurase [Armatimonadota bacterium]|nr:cysteine desulfurase [bacterium]MDW8322415.1 cysteine desulfurase [Armatimonadota bacterium]